ncbi:head-tail joining protein [Oricola indica]|uniref:head-tail joining protein n=1 Tax=Oricola indica TaxID=2872591 RepID=UPI001CBCCC31|nr:hypothetical protein [Oricola indica]
MLASDEFDAEIQGALNAEWGEVITYTPMRQRPNKGPVRDHGRGPAFVVCAIYTAPSRAKPESFNNRMYQTGISVQNPVFEIRVCDLPDGFAIKQGDTITRVDGTLFEVVEPRHNGHAVVCCEVVAKGQVFPAPRGPASA